MSIYGSSELSGDLAQLGSRLRAIRESAGKSYDDVCSATHVRPHILRAIEEGHLDGVAAPVYLRGFIKTYCQYLSADDVWQRYDERLQSPARQPIDDEDIAPIDVSLPKPFKRTSMIWVYILLVAAVIGVAFLLWHQRSYDGQSGDGFFLKIESADRTPSPDYAPPSTLAAEISRDVTIAVETMATAVSIDESSAEQIAASVDALFAPSSEEQPKSPASPDLSWLDGATKPVQEREIQTVSSQIPDQKLFIRIASPTGLVVKRNGEILTTRRLLAAGAERSYDVTAATDVSFTSGSGADVTWYGRRYKAIGSDDKPLSMTFYPDGTVSVREGETRYQFK